MPSAESSLTMDPTSLDMDLISRLYFVLGKSAMERMSKSKVLIVGMGGLGVEIAKNLVLTGVQNITLYDPNKTEVSDLSSQFFLGEEDIGHNRAERSLSKLRGLSQTASVSIWPGKLLRENLKEFQAVVVAETNEDPLLDLPIEELSSFCHENDVHLIHCTVRGPYYRAFCDFGPNFVVAEVNEMDPQSILVACVANDEKGLVTCTVEKSHGLQVGDQIVFSHVEQMEDLGTRTVKELLSSSQILIGKTNEYSLPGVGGFLKKVTQPFTLKYEKYEAARLNKKAVMQTDFKKNHLLCHLAFLSLDQIKRGNNSKCTVKDFLETAETLNRELGILPTLSKQSLRYLEEFWNSCDGCIGPIVSFLGGFVAQEVIKVCTRKFKPLFQWLVGDFIECFPLQVQVLQENNSVELQGRAFGCNQLLGTNTCNKLSNLKVFVVGAGAIGCELLKNLALLGVGTGPEGHITVTDMDRIEKSNLTRQFLFRNKDIGGYKSVVAAEKILEMNRDVKLKSLTLEVGVETENVFDHVFYSQLDVVINALDNKAARLYIDDKCVDFEIPLLESGTQGTKGSTQVIIPHRTKSYRETSDPDPEVFAKCTLTYFPYRIEHTIQWARDWFEELFSLCPKAAADYVDNRRDLSYYKQDEENGTEKLKQVAQFFRHKTPKSFTKCIELAHILFEETFETGILQLTASYPRDAETTEGLPFWSGTKKFPEPVKFNIEKKLHREFLESAACLYARIYGITQTDALEKALEYKPPVRSGIDRAFGELTVNDEDNQYVSQEEIEELYSKLPPIDCELAKLRIQPETFEKDDDNNGHVKFIHSAAMLRGSNYSIELVDILTTKRLAGKIIPAIVTSTSVVAGLVCVELIKLFSSEHNEGSLKFRDSYINLSIPSLMFVNPTASPIFNQNKNWSVWSKIDISGKQTLREFIEETKFHHNVNVSVISCTNLMLFFDMMHQEGDPIYSKTLNDILKEAFPNISCTKNRFCKLVVTPPDGGVLPPVFCYF